MQRYFGLPRRRSASLITWRHLSLQVVFAASLAKSSFYCLGDFRQLPAIVQNPSDNELKKDIFNYTEISSAVENGYGHNWLVMLDEQYRMHPDIARFASRYMYEGLLNSPDKIYEKKQAIADIGPLPGNPIGMIDIQFVLKLTMGHVSICFLQ